MNKGEQDKERERERRSPATLTTTSPSRRRRRGGDWRREEGGEEERKGVRQGHFGKNGDIFGIWCRSPSDITEYALNGSYF